MTLPKKAVSGDGQEGYEVPVRDKSAMRNLNEKTVFRAKKKQDNGCVTLWGGGNLYYEWKGNPVFFSWLD